MNAVDGHGFVLFLIHLLGSSKQIDEDDIMAGGSLGHSGGVLRQPGVVLTPVRKVILLQIFMRNRGKKYESWAVYTIVFLAPGVYNPILHQLSEFLRLIIVRFIVSEKRKNN